MLFEGKVAVVFGVAVGRMAVVHHQKIAQAEVLVFCLTMHTIMFPELWQLAPLVCIESRQQGNHQHLQGQPPVNNPRNHAAR